MRGTHRHIAAFAIVWITSACGTGNTNVDPGDLELRDLLGVAPEVATTWDAEQRSSARHVVVDALDDEHPARNIEIDSYRSDEQFVRALTSVDSKRFDAGDDALAFVRVSGSRASQLSVLVAPDAKIVDALAAAADHDSGQELVVVREPRLTVAAAYVDGTPARLLVNPVVLEVFDQGDATFDSTAKRPTTVGGGDLAKPTKTKAIAANGNPYSFFGSISECAYAQRLRCEACLPSSSCNEAITSATGMEECTKLAENDGRGYFLLCINLALSISSVDDCTANAVSSCSRNTGAANDLGQLEANATFLTDTSCSGGLDGCLAKIYGNPNGTFPGLIDGGMSTPPPNPPRDPEISCGDGCSSDNNSNCEASPNCSCDGPSCNNSLSCDSTCASSNDQSGCGGGCSSCESEGGGSSGGGGCGGSSSGGSSSGGGCGGGGDSGGCGGCSSSSSSSGGSSGGGGCGGGDCGGGGGCSDSGGGGSCGGGGGGGGCQVAKKEPSAAFAVAFSLAWAFLPIPVAAMVRRRSRKQKKKTNTDDADTAKEVQS